MKVRLKKLTPHPKENKKAWADFELPEQQISIKGVFVTSYGKEKLHIGLPSITTHKGALFTPVTFASQEIASEFFRAAALEVLETYPPNEWKKGIWSQFNQGLKK